jgi:hypothetical protein
MNTSDHSHLVKNSNDENSWYRTVLNYIPFSNSYFGATIQIDKKDILEYHNRIISKVFYKTEFFSKSGHWYYSLSSNTISISNTLKKILNAKLNDFTLNGFLEFFRNLGFDMFDDFIDNSYDTVFDDISRFESAFLCLEKFLNDVKKLSENDKIKLQQRLSENQRKYFDMRISKEEIESWL